MSMNFRWRSKASKFISEIPFLSISILRNAGLAIQGGIVPNILQFWSELKKGNFRDHCDCSEIDIALMF